MLMKKFFNNNIVRRNESDLLKGVILDKKLKPWLLEINYTPSFTADTPLDKRIKEDCVKEALELVNISHKNKETFIKEERIRISKRSFQGRESKLGTK